MIYLFSFACGLLFAPLIPSSVPMLLVSVCLLCAGICRLILQAASLRAVSTFLCVLLLGISLGLVRLEWKIAQQLPEIFAGQDFQVRFEVVSLPKVASHVTTFNALIRAVECTGECPAVIGKKVRLSWYRTRQAIQPGDIWQAEVRLKPPRGLANPEAFDYHAWLLGQGIAATGYVRDGQERIGRAGNLAAARTAVAEAVFKPVDSQLGYARFLTALLTGDKRGLTEQDWQLLQRTGTIHLMAISGLHIGLVALAAFLIGGAVARLISLFSAGSGVRIIHFLPPAAAVLAALAYAALAGFTVPTVRALVGCVAVNLCLLGCIRLSAWWVLGVCLCVVVLFEPLAAFNAGFWLSFLAVVTLLYCFSGRRAGFGQFFTVQWVLMLGLAVPLLMLGQQVAWLGPVANTLAVPVVTVAVVPLLMAGAALTAIWPMAGGLLLKLSDQVFGLLWRWLEWVGARPVPEVLNHWASACSPLLAALALALLLAPRGLYLRTLGLAVLLVSLLPVQTRTVFRFSVLDVGQGLAAVIQSPQSLWVFDAGPRFSEAFDAGASIVAPYVQRQNIAYMGLLVSHNDGDHAGGVEGLMAKLDGSGRRFEVFQAAEPLAVPGHTADVCVQGRVLETSGITLQILWPPAGHRLERNAASCVVLVTLHLPGKDIRILLPGDIDKRVERQLLPELTEPVDIVVAPHHGSATSSSVSFVHAVNAGFVIYSAGYRNRYRHPHPDVVARYDRVGSQALNTGRDGAITFEWDEAGELRLSAWRQAAGRRWFRP